MFILILIFKINNKVSNQFEESKIQNLIKSGNTLSDKQLNSPNLNVEVDKDNQYKENFRMDSSIQSASTTMTSNPNKTNKEFSLSETSTSNYIEKNIEFEKSYNHISKKIDRIKENFNTHKKFMDIVKS